MLNIFAAMAQFEREMMLERQREGMAKAKAQGRYKGRKLCVKSTGICSRYTVGGGVPAGCGDRGGERRVKLLANRRDEAIAVL
jgi:hypothetical protein